MTAGTTADRSPAKAAAFDWLILIVFFTCWCSLLYALHSATPGANLASRLLLGALLGLVLTRRAAFAARGGFRPPLSDWLLLLWIAAEIFSALHARLRFAALEGLRDALLAPAVYLAASGALYRLKRPALLLFGVLLLALAAICAFTPVAAGVKGVWIPPAGCACFCLLALRRDCDAPGGRMLQKAVLALAVIGVCTSFYTALLPQRDDAAGRARRQREFQSAQLARRIAAEHPLLGAGRGHFDWYRRAYLGTDARAVSAPLRLSPWPYLAEIGLLNLLLILALIFNTLFFVDWRRRRRRPHSCFNVSVRCALLIVLVCGFMSGLLFSAPGLFAAFFCVGMLRGQQLEWRKRELDRQPPAPQSAKSGARRAWRAGALLKRGALGAASLCVIALCASGLAVPEAALLLCRNSAPERPAFQFATALYPIYPQLKLLEARILSSELETFRAAEPAQTVGFVRRDRARLPRGAERALTVRTAGINQITELYYLAEYLNPLDETVYLELRRWLETRLNDRAEAGRILERGLRRCPGSYALARQLAALQLREKHFLRALEILLPFEQQRHGDPALMETLAYCYQSLNQPQRARYYQEFTEQRRARQAFAATLN